MKRRRAKLASVATVDMYPSIVPAKVEEINCHVPVVPCAPKLDGCVYMFPATSCRTLVTGQELRDGSVMTHMQAGHGIEFTKFKQWGRSKWDA